MMNRREARAELLSPDCRLRYAAFQRGADRFPSAGYCSGTAADLAAASISEAAEILDARLTKDGKDRLSRAMGLRRALVA